MAFTTPKPVNISGTKQSNTMNWGNGQTLRVTTDARQIGQSNIPKANTSYNIKVGNSGPAKANNDPRYVRKF